MYESESSVDVNTLLKLRTLCLGRITSMPVPNPFLHLVRVNGTSIWPYLLLSFAAASNSPIHFCIFLSVNTPLPSLVPPFAALFTRRYSFLTFCSTAIPPCTASLTPPKGTHFCYPLVYCRSRVHLAHRPRLVQNNSARTRYTLFDPHPLQVTEKTGQL